MANSTSEIDFFRGENSRARAFVSPLEYDASTFSGIKKVASRINPDALKNSHRSPISRFSSETAPLTIFYNGMVFAFHLPRDKAEAIIRMAEREAIDSQRPEEPMIRGDPPIARKNSLKRFLDKRKERCRGTITGRPLIRLP